MGKMQVVINGRKGHTIIVKYVVKRLSNAKGDNMKRNNKWLDLVLYILSAEVIGMSSGLLAGSFNEFFQKYNKPPLMPSSWVFEKEKGGKGAAAAAPALWAGAGPRRP
mgnify:CR=1 FL=1